MNSKCIYLATKKGSKNFETTFFSTREGVEEGYLGEKSRLTTRINFKLRKQKVALIRGRAHVAPGGGAPREHIDLGPPTTKDLELGVFLIKTLSTMTHG